MVTIDASVWLAAMSAQEKEHKRCATLVETLIEHGVALHQPGLFIIEVCATIARRTRDRSLALAAGEATLATPHLTLYALDHELAAESADIAATCALRGADAVYVALARYAGSTLITLDREVHQRASDVAVVRSPFEWLQNAAP